MGPRAEKGSKRKAEGMEMESSSTKPQELTTSKKAKKYSSSKSSYQSSKPEISENKEKNMEALLFVWKESRRCQLCSKSYDKVNKAHECLLSHKNTFERSKFRCYLCFSLFKDTDLLFDHYKSNHQTVKGKVDKLLCSCCDKKVIYKNISAHVISCHAISQIPENCKPKVNSVETLESKE